MFPGEKDANVQISFRRDGSALFVDLAGDADLFSSSVLKRELSEHMNNVTMLIFDLENVEFADSYFIRLLIHLRKRLGGISSVTCVNAKPCVKRIFEVTGLDQLFMP